MTNYLKVVPQIAKEAWRQLDNNLVFGKKVFRGYDEEFSKRPNGYKIGETLSIRKPTDFTIREGQVMDVQPIVEGSTTIALDRFIGVDFEVSNLDMTLSITEFSERIIKPAVIKIANRIDSDLASLFYNVNNWAGTNPPSSPINSFADFAKGPERLTEGAVPLENRMAVLCPNDYWGLVGSQTALYMETVGKQAYRDGESGMVAGVSISESQNVASLTTGTRTNGAVDQTLTPTTVSYVTYKDADYYTIHLDGLGTGGTIKKGEVFTIDDCYDVNPVTKARLAHLKQFTVMEDATADSVTTGDADVKIWPAPIGDGAFKTCDFAAGSLNDKTVTWWGNASTVYRQNLVFNRDAFALVIMPLAEPVAAVGVSTASHKGTSIRVVPGYDQVNNIEKWRLDVLYGVKCIDPRQAVRLSGSS